MNISFNLQTFTWKGHFCSHRSSSVWIPVFVFRYKWRVFRRLPLRPSVCPRLEMQLSDGEDAGQHGLHGTVVQRGGGEPQWAVGDTAALGVKVEQVGALLDRLRAG